MNAGEVTGGLKLLGGGGGDRGMYGTWYDWLCANPEEWPSCPECGEHDVSLVPMPHITPLSNAGVVGECPRCGWHGGLCLATYDERGHRIDWRAKGLVLNGFDGCDTDKLRR